MDRLPDFHAKVPGSNPASRTFVSIKFSTASLALAAAKLGGLIDAFKIIFEK